VYPFESIQQTKGMTPEQGLNGPPLVEAVKYVTKSCFFLHAVEKTKTLRTIRSKNYKLHLSKSRMVGEIYFSDYEWAFESAEEAIEMCNDYQQQGG